MLSSISALLVATHIINFQGNLRKFVKDLSGPTHPTTQYSGLLDCFPLVASIFILTKFEILTNILQLGTILNQER